MTCCGRVGTRCAACSCATRCRRSRPPGSLVWCEATTDAGGIDLGGRTVAATRGGGSGAEKITLRYGLLVGAGNSQVRQALADQVSIPTS